MPVHRAAAAWAWHAQSHVGTGGVQHAGAQPETIPLGQQSRSGRWSPSARHSSSKRNCCSSSCPAWTTLQRTWSRPGSLLRPCCPPGMANSGSGATSTRCAAFNHTAPPLRRLAACADSCALMQVDGGLTFTEPTAIICGNVEGLSDVSWRRVSCIRTMAVQHP